MPIETQKAKPVCITRVRLYVPENPTDGHAFSQVISKQYLYLNEKMDQIGSICYSQLLKGTDQFPLLVNTQPRGRVYVYFLEALDTPPEPGRPSL